MKKWIYLAMMAAFLAVLIFAPLALKAQWGPSSGPVGPMASPAIQRATVYEWKASHLPSDEGRVLLFKNGSYVGTWDAFEEYYRAYDPKSETWGPREFEPPIPLPGHANRRIEPIGQPLEPWQLSGVDKSKVNGKDHESFTISGKRVHRLEALHALAGNLEDDSGKMWLILIGEKTARDKALADMKADPKMQSLLAQVRIVSQPPSYNQFFYRETGEPMYPPGNPTVYLGKPDGEEIFVSTQFGPAEMEALRKKDPTLPKLPDPKKPDDSKKPDVQPANPSAPTNWTLIGLGAILVALITGLFLKRN